MPQDNLKQKTKKGLYWRFLDLFFNQGMQFIVGIVMARLLSPSDYGITALPVIFIAIANVFIDGGFGLALIRKPELTEKDLSTSFYYSIIVGILCYAFLFIAAPFIANFYKIPVLTSLIRVTAITFIWSPLNTPQTVILNRLLDFRTMARISIVNKILSAVLGIVAAYYGYGLWALVIYSLSSSLMGVLQSWFVVKWFPKERFSKKSFMYLWNFGNKMIGTRLLDSIFSNITPVVIGKYFSTSQLGYYNRALSFGQLPSMQIGGVIQGVTFPVLSKIQNDDASLVRGYRKMIKTTAFIVFPLMFLLSALAKPIIMLLLTDKWAESVLLLQILCFYLMWGPVSVMNLNLLQVKGRTDLCLSLQYKKNLFGLIIMFLTLPFGLVAFCCGQFINQMFTILLNMSAVGKTVGMGYIQQMKDLAPIWLLSFTMFLLSLLLVNCLDNTWLQLLTGGFVGSLYYIGLSLLLKFDELNEVKYMLNKK